MAHGDTPPHEAAKPPEPPAPIFFLPIDEVARRVGLSRRAVYNNVDSGSFPNPVKLSERRIAFVESKIAAWQEARISERPE